VSGFFELYKATFISLVHNSKLSNKHFVIELSPVFLYKRYEKKSFRRGNGSIWVCPRFDRWADVG
jgi:hypothetical protein